MKVRLIVEGVHEGGDGYDGPAATLLRRIWDRQIEIEIQIHKSVAPRTKIHRDVLGRGMSHFGKKLLGMIRDGCDGGGAVVVLFDEDGRPDMRRAAQQCRDAIAALSYQGVVGLAIRTFDAWHLADEVAISRVCGRDVETQPNPEGLADAKERCRKLASSGRMALREFYARMAEALDIDRVADRCPRGFGVFVQDVRRLRG